MHLKKRFINKNKIIFNYYKKAIKLTKDNRSVGSTTEWLIDNYYIIDSQKKGLLYYLSTDNYKSIKHKEKTYDLVYSVLRDKNFQLNYKHLFNVLNKYQEETNHYFSYKEIEYIYNLVGLVLIDRLGDLCNVLDLKLTQKREIETLFEEINKRKADENFNVNDVIKIDETILNKPYYIEELNYKLGELGVSAEKVQIKMEEIFKEKGVELNKIITEQQEALINENILIMNIFSSIKKSSKNPIDVEGHDFYSNISFSEKLLLEEKAGFYSKMTDDSKYRYRKEIEKKSKYHNEYDYVIKLINSANKENKHVGFYLFNDKCNNFKAYLYIASVVLLAIFMARIIYLFTDIWAFILILIPMIGLSVDIITQILLRFIDAKALFSLKVEDNIKKEHSTMVVIPTIVKDKKRVEAMFENLELFYLSNKSDNIYFTLLGDAAASKTEGTPYDDEVVETGIRIVKELNEKYGDEIFYFAYRNRFYSDDQECYLGRERKRGALIEFNDLLLGHLSEEEINTRYKVNTFKKFNKKIKYIITLDADTKLVLSTALKLVGVMIHPMNKPILNKEGTRVILGHAMVQPKVNIEIEVTDKSEYSQLYGGLGGLDVYSRTTFDLYQDVFDEGSFVGKGIYDLEIFQKLLKNTFPDNLILSHDLLEGSYLRSGFASNIEVFDGFPSKYLNDTARHHRWTRGDWQILFWLKNKTKNKNNELVDNPLNLISRWKIFDNLRRSINHLFFMLFLFYGFTIGKGSPTAYLCFALLTISIPIIFYIISLFRKRKYTIFLKYYLNLIRGFLSILIKSSVAISVLPFETHLYTDAVVRTINRLFVSKKHRLDWVTADEVEKRSKGDIRTYISNFNYSTIITVSFVFLSLLFKPEYYYLVFPLSFAWLFAPILMYLLSKDFKRKKDHLSENILDEYEKIAYKTWKYFEHYLVKKYNYLIPDNYQLNRRNKLDYRTSSTNIGFSLLSIICAYELKFIKLEEAIDKISNIINSVEGLEKWHGHLYNWYNILDSKKMTPYFVSTVDSGNFVGCLFVVKEFLKSKKEYDVLANRIEKIISDTNFEYLYDKDSDVFSIGFDVGNDVLSNYNYDKFLSESRLVSYIAISMKQVPYRHWFLLDKSLTKHKFRKGLISWNGTSFEYFMPLIFMESFPYTLLDETYSFGHYVQKDFIKEVNSKLPWGITESAYNDLDDSQNYKYKAFGVPYLKFADTKKPRVVISPYGSILAAPKFPLSVYNNINKLKKYDMEGEYGFYEAYDAEEEEVVKTYYAHHQGMIICSITNLLKENIIQKYFNEDRRIKSMEILLKEKTQLKPYIDLKIEKYRKYEYTKDSKDVLIRFQEGIKDIPDYGIISNGLYTTLINDRGIGFTKYKNLQINRYRNVPEEPYGLFLYIKNLSSNVVWTNTYEPFMKAPDKYNVTFEPGIIKYIREDNLIITKTEIIVSKEDSVEIRKVTINNYNIEDVDLELTSYGELIMARAEEDIAHRAFNGVSISSTFDEETSSLIFKRHSRTKDLNEYYVAHRMLILDDNSKTDYETSRSNFIGRNRSLNNAEVIVDSKRLSNDKNALLDPIMSIRKNITLKANKQKTIYLVTCFGKSKEQVLDILDIYDNTETMKATYRESELFGAILDGHSNLNSNQIFLYNHMLKKLYNYMPYNFENEKLLLENNMSKNEIWKFGISDNWPIITVMVDDFEGIGVAKQILKAYEYYKKRSIYIDIVILNKEQNTIKKETINKYVYDIIYKINSQNNFEEEFGTVFVIDKFNYEDEKLFKLVSKLYFETSLLKASDNIFNKIEKEIVKYDPLKYPRMVSNNKKVEVIGELINEGTEYKINTINTPAPWSNVLTNGEFGAVITNNMGGFTYSGNSREYKITSWSNDSVSDPRSEDIIIDNKSISIDECIHGFGYTKFITKNDNYEINTKVFVGMDNVKIYELEVTNKFKDNKSLPISLMLSPVLGTSKEYNYPYIVAEANNTLNSLMLYNRYSSQVFKDREVFVTSTEKIVDFDIYNDFKSISIGLNIKKGETKKLSFIIGSSIDNSKLISKYSKLENIDLEYQKVVEFWKEKLSFIKVNTKDNTFDYAINGWYLYQVYASRLYARSGLYQVGGAYGFRDQLQDSMSILYSDPKYSKFIILNCASHQFETGDVLHWWHEDLNLGSRTRFSDDYLWLVYVTLEYIKITGDYSILYEEVPFIKGPELSPTEGEKGISYYKLERTSPLYNHLKLSIDRSFSLIGKHGIPLMGVGDWNDGMNRVGHKGKGESVWVGMFLYDITNKFESIMKYMKEPLKNIAKYKKDNEKLLNSINTNCWDGNWFLRAFNDEGYAIGSKNNHEGEIDLLVQSWSILTNVADISKQKQVIQEVEARLVDKKSGIIKLLTPPFTCGEKNPGYISYYLKGIRENGGQYTHAALWYIKSLIKYGEKDRAYEYFSMINPMNREIDKYKVEPYVIAADIYSNTSHKGRGGWTWYTGSAGWAYKIAIEDILGMKKEGKLLDFEPKVPSNWNSFSIKYKYESTLYIINITIKDKAKKTISLDGLKVKELELIDDKIEHNVDILIGREK